MIYEDFLLPINVKRFGRNKYLLIQEYVYICDQSRHVNMYSTHKRHKRTLFFSVDRQCILLPEVMQEKNPCFWLFLLWISDPWTLYSWGFLYFSNVFFCSSPFQTLSVSLCFELNFWPIQSPFQFISPFFCYPSQISSCCRVCGSRWVRETLRGSAFWIFSSNCWIGSVDLEGPVGSQGHLHKSSILLHWPKDLLYPLTRWWLHSSRAILKEGFSCYDLFRDIVLKVKVSEKLFPAQGK